MGLRWTEIAQNLHRKSSQAVFAPKPGRSQHLQDNIDYLALEPSAQSHRKATKSPDSPLKHKRGSYALSQSQIRMVCKIEGQKAILLLKYRNRQAYKKEQRIQETLIRKIRSDRKAIENDESSYLGANSDTSSRGRVRKKTLTHEVRRKPQPTHKSMSELHSASMRAKT